MSRTFFIVAILAAVLGCATGADVDSGRISPARADRPRVSPGPASDQTRVYLIRKGSFYGGGRGMLVAAGDRVVGSLLNDSHLILDLPSGVNTLGLVQNFFGLSFFAVDNRAGETVYLLVQYVGGVIEEVSEEVGKEAVARTRFRPLLETTRENVAYDEGLLNPGRMSLGLMHDRSELLIPDQETAVVSFMRPGSSLGEYAFDIWSAEGYVGSLKGREYLQVRLPPGPNAFIAKSERHAVLMADLEAGREYFVRLTAGMGWVQPHVKLLPLDAKTDAKKIGRWRRRMQLRGLDPGSLARAGVQVRLEAGHDLLSKFRAKVERGEVSVRTLAR